MVNLTINNRPVSVEEGTTIMQAASKIGINIPHLCYLKELNEIAACRVCVVEIAGNERLTPSCNTICQEGMKVYTNSPKVRNARRTMIRLILSQHNCECTACVRSGNCSLQKVAYELGVHTDAYHQDIPRREWDQTFPLIKDESKCIKCMRCVQVCDKIQGLNIWDVVNTGCHTRVAVKDNKKICDADCSLCGQCITHCPVAALHEREDIVKVLTALNDPEVVTVVQIAPAVRAAWGEDLSMKPELATEKRLAAILKAMGFDFVFDTNFAADLTIMEEGNEFVGRFTRGELDKFPMFTSCCPGWMRYAKTQYPEILDYISTAKSPQQMFGATVKSYFAKKTGIDPKKIFSVSIMPCVAKKAECDIPVMNDAGAGQDVDCVITTREFARIVEMESIDPEYVDECEFDSPLGTYTGAAVIFGATGGVMEAALRTGYNIITGENPPLDVFNDVRGMKPWKEFNVKIGDIEVKTAVVHGLKNAGKLIDALKAGEVKYHFVEVMACPGGCVGGGGQPIHEGVEMAEARAPKLYSLDKNAKLRFSHENPEVIAAYEEYFEKPNSEIAHHLLHTDHKSWKVHE